MSRNAIIHLSDLHISKKNSANITEIISSLANDIKISTEGTIDFIVFSGDLVFSGQHENFELAYNEFIAPLLAKVGLDETAFICVPGNHEVDISKVDMDFSESFTKRILKNGVAKVDLEKPNVQERLKEYFVFLELFYKWEQKDLVKTIKVLKNGVNYGFTLLNTAWNTAGDSENEAKKIIVCREEIVSSIKEIEQCEKKVIVMHHPIDWFFDDNASEIEPLLSKYDLVLTGHKHHEYSGLLVHMNNTTIFNSCSKLDINSEENGYTIFEFDSVEARVYIKNRTYIKKRLLYAPDVSIADDGISVVELKQRDQTKQMVSDIILKTKKNFIGSLDRLFITNLLESGETKKFEELFVMPTIDKYSEGAKEKYDDPDKEVLDIIKEIQSNKYVTFWGKKENGKTILAHYIAKYFYDNYLELQRLPIVIDCKLLPTYKTAMIKAISNTVNELFDSSYSISKDEIDEMAKSGALLIILDNYENNEKQAIQLEELEKIYPSNKFVFFRDEAPAVFSDEDKMAVIDTISNNSHLNLFIRNMDKHHIRLLAKNMSSVNPAIEDAYVDKIVYSFSTNNMPRTPFAVSLILAICSESADYMPTNQAKIVENFMEKILEKLSPQEFYSKTYDFNNKEKFLSELACEIHKTDSYYLTKENFDLFTLQYHERKAYDLKDSRFDQIFFDKGILVEYADKVFFRYECLIHYYLAKYCLANQGFFKQKILGKDNYLNNTEVISYYSGLSREDSNVLSTIIGYAKPYIEENKDCENLLELDTIKLQIDIPNEEIERCIAETEQIPVEEKDKLTDKPDRSIHYNPTKVKVEVQYNENIAFGILIELLGNVLRSSEELDARTKQEAFSSFLQGCIILWKQYRESLLGFAHKVNEELIVKKQAEEGKNIEEIREALDKAYSDFCDIIKLSVPLAMSNFIYESIGTEKMKKIFTEAYNNCPTDSPERLLLIMLVCDLKMKNWPQLLKDYIKTTTKKDFLWVMFFKCQHYLQFNYFGDETKKIIGPTADCYIAVNNMNKRIKSQLVGKIESKKLIGKTLD